ncbi:MAG: membrane integrity-associated transporter subunit PqiC [Alphaproteobacteria bacterium]|nr:membrane integrity-associated transporter subunit PqiC [Alphaproteobacteria bacterium]
MKKIVFLFVLLLAGCGISKPSTFYHLQAASQDVVISQKNITVGIDEVIVPKYADRPQMVMQEADSSELKISEFNRWAEPLSYAISRILADDMSLYMPKATIKPKTYISENFDYTISVEISKFDITLNQQVALDSWWTIFKNGNIIYQGRSRFSEPVDDNLNNVVKAQSQLINQMAEQIALKLTKL